MLVATGLTFGVIGAFGWITDSQVIDLAWKLPSYEDNLLAKIADLESAGSGLFAGIIRMFENLDRDDAPEAGALPEPARVQVVAGTSSSRLGRLPASLGPSIAFLGSARAVVVLVLFMPFNWEDLRDRIIGLIGRGNISKTTLAMVGAARKVNGYLRMQLLVNLLYGIPVAVGLTLIGVPNATSSQMG